MAKVAATIDERGKGLGLEGRRGGGRRERKEGGGGGGRERREGEEKGGGGGGSCKFFLKISQKNCKL